MITAFEQFKIIIYYILFGMFIACTFDFLGLLTYKSKLFMKYIYQLIYWICLIYIATIYIINNTSHYITLYSIFLFITGIIIYYSFIANYNKSNILIIIPYLKKLYQISIIIFIPITLFKYLLSKLSLLINKIKILKNKKEKSK